MVEASKSAMVMVKLIGENSEKCRAATAWQQREECLHAKTQRSLVGLAIQDPASPYQAPMYVADPRGLNEQSHFVHSRLLHVVSLKERSWQEPPS